MQTIGIVTNITTTVFHQTVIKGAQDEAKRQDYDIEIIEVSSPDQEFETRHLAGLLIVSNTLPNDRILALHNEQIPISLISHHIPHVTIPSVMPDNEQGMIKIVDYMVNTCGYRSFVYVQGDMNQDDAILREQTFRRELLRHIIELPESHFVRGDFNETIAANAMREFLQVKHDFEAVVVADFVMGVSVKNVIESSGMKIPQDVAIIAFGDGSIAKKARLTTVDVNVLELGKRGIQQIIGQCKGLTMRGTTVVHTQIIERATCLPLKNRSKNNR